MSVAEHRDVLRVPADVVQLAAVRAFIRDRAARAGAGPRAIDNLVTAVDESVTNVILHGYRGKPGNVEIDFAHADKSLVVQLRDQAPPFDPTKMPEPDTSLPLEERPLGGMGILLSRQMTDSITYRRTGDGNELTLVMKLSQQES